MAVPQYERYSVSRWDARRAPLAALSLSFFFFLLLLSYLSKSQPRDIVLKRPHTAELHGTFKDVFFFLSFFFISLSSLVTPPPKKKSGLRAIWFEHTRSHTGQGSKEKQEEKICIRIFEIYSIKSWNTFSIFSYQASPPSHYHTDVYKNITTSTQRSVISIASFYVSLRSKL